MDKVNVLETIKGKFGDRIVDSHSFRGDDTVIVKKESIKSLCLFLKEDVDLDFDYLLDVCGVDYLPRKPRFEVVYHLYSLQFNHRIRVKVPVAEEDCKVDSMVTLYKTANWYEREIWDLYGVKFNGHPNMTRILLYEGFKGHPLRKDYPINKRQPLIGPMN